MKIEIWSDIACPFCYIGKRNFETALAQFPHKDRIEVVWRSFQIIPDAKYGPGMDTDKALAEHLGTTVAEAKRMNEHVVALARNAGLIYNMSERIWANTFDAHRLIQYSMAVGLSDQLEETLFQAHFTDGKNVQDHATLLEISTGAGLDGEAVEEILNGDKYSEDVRADLEAALRLGLRGVPFYVIDGGVSFSGAQSVAAFLQILETAFANWHKERQS